MTGKELVLAFVGAGLVGGGAGVAASVAVAPRPEAPSASPNAEILDRLKVIEGQLAQARTAAEDSRRTLNEVQERVTKAELQASREAAAAETGAAPAGAMQVRLGRHGTHSAEGGPNAAGVILDDADLADLGGQIAVNLGDELGKLDVEVGDISSQIETLRNGFKLRALPEADRWQKAKDELGLTWNQVEDLKKAVADRDTAMKDAMTKETKSGANGGTITIQRPDPAKSAHAEAAYHDRVNATLGEQQKKDWGSKGYDHAFGSAPFGGGSMTMAIGVSTDAKPDDAPKDSTK
jgi:hypothetical protein